MSTFFIEKLHEETNLIEENTVEEKRPDEELKSHSVKSTDETDGTSSSDQEVAEYEQSPWRWVNVACLFGACMAQSSLMMTFTPVAALVRDGFEVGDFVVSSNASVFLFVLAVLDLPSAYLLDSGETQGEGMAKWFKIASFLTILGQWGRYLALLMYPDQFWMTVVPAVIMAAGQPFLLNGISKLACIWFSDAERVVAIGILAFSFALGSIVSLVLGPIFVLEKDKEEQNLIREETVQYMLAFSCITTFLCGPMLLLYRQRPNKFPSRSAQEDANQVKSNEHSMLNQLTSLLRNRNFMFVLIIFSIMNGSYVSLGAIINFLLEPYGFTSIDTSILGTCFIISGLCSSIVFPILIAKYHWFLQSLRTIVLGAFVSSVIVLVALPSKSYVFSMLSISLLGIFVIPTMSVVYAFAIELTYPISETLFGCLLQAGSGIFGTLITYLGSFIINRFGPSSMLSVYAALFLLSCVISGFVKEDLRRLKMGTQEEKQKSSVLSQL